jgi:hypothetical protein
MSCTTLLLKLLRLGPYKLTIVLILMLCIISQLPEQLCPASLHFTIVSRLFTSSSFALFDITAATKRVSIASGHDFGLGLELGLMSGMEVDGLKLKPALDIIGVDGRARTAISAPAWANSLDDVINQITPYHHFTSLNHSMCTLHILEI